LIAARALSNLSAVKARSLSLCALALAACGPELRELRHPDGALYERGEWSGELRDGRTRSLFPDGRPERDVGYRAGLREGAWSVWNADGVLVLEGRYAAGMRQGEWIERHDSGAVKSRGHYVAGDKDGVWTLGREDGTPIYEELWRAGTLLETRELAPR